MDRSTYTAVLRWGIALVWFGNGLLAKVLGLIPRHEEIVAQILGTSWSHSLTIAIGVGECAIGAWFLSRKWTRLNAVIQMGLVATMNLIEFVLAADLLLWGRLNIVFAATFVGVVYCYEFRLSKG